MTYLPLALCKILLDLSTDRLMNVLLQGSIPSNPDTESRRCVLVNVQRVEIMYSNFIKWKTKKQTKKKKHKLDRKYIFLNESKVN